MTFFHNQIYPHLPVFLQHVVVSVYGLLWRKRRLGGVFKEQVKEFKSREYYSYEQWLAYQERELRKLLVHAYTTVPYYATTYKACGIELGDLISFRLNDLSKLPMLEKETLRSFGKTDLVSSKILPGRKFFTSSGSTGTPVNILFSVSTQQTWYAAYEARCRNWAGVSYTSSRAMIGGRRVVFGNPARPPFHRFNCVENQVYLSIYHVSKENFMWYYRVLQNRKPEYLVGYSSSIFLLATLLMESGLQPLRFKAVIGSSEKLTTEMRVVIAQAFQCPVYDSWSGIEACALITEHPDGNLYISPDCGIIEFLNSEAQPVKCGEEGEMICTGLLNFDQPLIRYRIGDLGVPLDPLTNQAIQMPRVNEIVGRTDDIITLRDGRRLGSFNRFFADLKGIREVQVVQEDYDHFILNLVPTENFGSAEKEAILNSLKSRLGNVDVDIRIFTALPRSSNGKIKAVVSRIGLDTNVK
jgi:phenylacetate-CoA ligase